jgi:hypothetical protein
VFGNVIVPTVSLVVCSPLGRVRESSFCGWEVSRFWNLLGCHDHQNDQSNKMFPVSQKCILFCKLNFRVWKIAHVFCITRTAQETKKLRKGI